MSTNLSGVKKTGGFEPLGMCRKKKTKKEDPPQKRKEGRGGRNI